MLHIPNNKRGEPIMPVMSSPEDTLLELAFAVEPIEPDEANETTAERALRHGLGSLSSADHI